MPGDPQSDPGSVERGEGRWAGGCFFVDADTGERNWVPDSNLICVRVEG